MSNPAAPLGEDQFRLLLLGQLPEAEVERLALELGDDARLLAVAETIENLDDTLLDQLRGRQPFTDPGVEKFVARILTNFQSRRQGESPVEVETDTFAESPVPSQTEKGVGSGPFIAGPTHFPAQLDHFRIVRKLGEGGMGAVYLAQDTRLDRQVALKTLRPEIAGVPGAKERFLREARSAAALEHQHILAIYHVGEAHGVSYLAMPLLKGQGLNDLIKEKKTLPIGEALRYARQIAEGLSAAHAVGLIHRDIKPSNVWIEPNDGGRVKILDFGLARRDAEDAQLTGSGVIVGTPAYMAPEQGRGQKVDHRGDLFSLGVLLYEMTTGKRPFTGSDTMSILTSLAIDEPPNPAGLNPAIPESLSNFIVKLLAKKPANRPQSARAVVEELARIERQATMPIIELMPLVERAAIDPWQDIDVTTETAPPPSVKPMAIATGKKTKPWLMIGSAFGFLLACVLFAQIIIKIKDKDGKVTEIPVPADGSVEITKGGKTVFPPDPKAEEGFVIPKYKPYTPPALIPVGESPLDKLDPNEIPAVERYDWQPKELVAVIGEHRQRGTIRRFSADGNELIGGFGRDWAHFDLRTRRFSADIQGEWGFREPHPKEPSLFADLKGVFVEKNGETTLQHPFAIGNGATYAQFSNDGKWLFAAQYPDKCYLYAYSPDRLIEKAVYENVYWVTFSPKSDLLAIAHKDGVIRLYDLAAPKLSERNSLRVKQKDDRWKGAIPLSHEGRWLNGPFDFNVDGLLVVGDGFEKTLVAYDVSAPKPKEIATSGKLDLDLDWGWIRCPPSGNLVFYGSSWFAVAELKESGFRALPGPETRFSASNFYGLAFSPDGTKMATGSIGGFVHIWDITGPVIKEIDPLTPNPWAFDLNREGLLAVRTEAVDFAYWNLDGKMPRKVGSVANRSEAVPHFTPDGKTVLFPHPEFNQWTRPSWKEIRRFDSVPGGWLVGFPGPNLFAVLGLEKNLVIADYSKDPPEIQAEIPAKLPMINTNTRPLLTPDSKTLIRLVENGAVGLYDVTSTGVVFRLAIPESEKLGSILDFALSPDGSLLAIGGQGGTGVWDISKPKPLKKWQNVDDWGHCVSFSPDGSVLTRGGGIGVAIFAAASGKLQRGWRLPFGVNRAIFAPDGRHLLVLCSNRVLYVLRL